MLEFSTRPLPPPDDTTVLAIGQALQLPVMISQLLVSRGMDTVEAARAFLSPSMQDLPDAFELTGVPAAVGVINDAIARGDVIAIYGDYDVDGLSATAILSDAVRNLGGTCILQIPNRHTHGYGLHMQAIDEMVEQGAKLLLTVDNGIGATAEIAHARALGLEVVITDHHTPPETLPECAAVVHPQLGEARFGELCGAGVAWVLGAALCGWAWAERWLDVLALATVADMVPLTGVNRALVTLGLTKLRQDPHPGLAALAELADVTHYSEHTLGFVLAPRINANGRLGHALDALALLCATDLSSARPHAEKLQKDNQTRIDMEQALLRSAFDQVERIHAPADRLTLVYQKNWHIGMLGLIASRLVERYHRPAIVLCVDEQDACHGSARSIEGVNLYDCLAAASPLLTKFGGHAMAAGLALRLADCSALKETMETWLATNTADALYRKRATMDATLSVGDCTQDFVQALERLAPFGRGNPQPRFMLREVATQDARVMGRDQSHLAFDICAEQSRVNAVAFRMGQDHAALRAPNRFDFAVRLNIHTYRSRSQVQALVEAWRVSPDCANLGAVIEQSTTLLTDRFWQWAAIGTPYAQLPMCTLDEALAKTGVLVAFSPDCAVGLLGKLMPLYLQGKLDLGMLSPPDCMTLPSLWVAPDADEWRALRIPTVIFAHEPPCGMVWGEGTVYRLADAAEDADWLEQRVDRGVLAAVWQQLRQAAEIITTQHPQQEPEGATPQQAQGEATPGAQSSVTQRKEQGCTAQHLQRALPQYLPGVIHAALALFVEEGLLVCGDNGYAITGKTTDLSASARFAAYLDADTPTQAAASLSTNTLAPSDSMRSA